MPPFERQQKRRVAIIPKSITALKKGGVAIDSFVTGWREPNHTLKSHVAQEPLESGVLVSDHVVALPTELELKGMVSDVKDGGDAPGRAWAKVRELHFERAILDVVTEWGYYKDMVIKNAETRQTGRGMQFTLTLQQILQVGVFVGQIVNPAALRVEELTQAIVLDPSTDGTIAPDTITGTFGSANQDLDPQTLENVYDIWGERGQ